MNQDSLTPGRPATRAPVFFWITVGLLAMLLLGGAAAALLLVFEAGNINRSGGWGWLLVTGIYVVAITVVCSACALCTAVSLFRREPHRRLSIAILIISCVVVTAFGPNLIRAVNGLRRQHDEVARRSEVSSQPPASLTRDVRALFSGKASSQNLRLDFLYSIRHVRVNHFLYSESFSMGKKMGRPRLLKGEALQENFSVRLRPDEAKQVRAAIRKSGQKKSEWLRSAVVKVARNG